ncbi:NAD(P)-dependent dehydrogenase (short-subunit alcohol dehydrogenase family) [Variovorax sp. 54]|uniref:SDR family NAD(P)-dependent oxidoreductase n=1 Tax=Variovorax sp. 54 TaxID=2035212 RepID=UPI000C57CDA1|nr:SDR family oxidoreductase [Variovorax sp. 54]PIF73700.1 NAD(P)-dependent dehydrogenase (short-subunit alcohol dehydrogenase family) [Variovorax sp. 54]
MTPTRMPPTIDLHGKVAWVTGGGAGIGRAIVEAYVQLGARVVVAEADPGRAAGLEAALNAQGADALVSCTDVRNPEQVDACVAAIGQRYGRLDVLVNNVGDFLRIFGRFERHTEAQWEQLYDINLKQVFRVTRAALPLMLRTEGDRSIINLTTIEAFRGIPNCPVYSAFKAGLTGFTRSLAVGQAPRGIRVNAIAPETTDSLQVDLSGLPPGLRENPQHWVPLGRYGRPRDVAGAAVFLASELSSWVTGTTLHVDGGALAAGGFYRTPEGHWTNAPLVSGSGFSI